MTNTKEAKEIQTIDIKKIETINFESSSNKQSFDKIEKENFEILQSVRVAQESLKLRFEI